MGDEIAVWFAGGAPVRLVWRGVRYRVNDVPTALSPADIWWPPQITHPPMADWRGWRFQAVDDEGIATVFDIREVDLQSSLAARRWEIVAVHGEAALADRPRAGRARGAR